MAYTAKSAAIVLPQVSLFPAAAVNEATIPEKERGRWARDTGQRTSGFGAVDDEGYWRGLDVETCRSIHTEYRK